jgi:hypothetical protein
MQRLWYLVHAVASSVAVWFAYKIEPVDGCLGPDQQFEATMEWIVRFFYFQLAIQLLMIGIRYKDWPWNVVLGIATIAWTIAMFFVAGLAGACL